MYTRGTPFDGGFLFHIASLCLVCIKPWFTANFDSWWKFDGAAKGITDWQVALRQGAVGSCYAEVNARWPCSCSPVSGSWWLRPQVTFPVCGLWACGLWACGLCFSLSCFFPQLHDISKVFACLSLYGNEPCPILVPANISTVSWSAPFDWLFSFAFWPLLLRITSPTCCPCSMLGSPNRLFDNSLIILEDCWNLLPLLLFIAIL